MDRIHPLRAWRLAQTPPVTLEVLAGRLGTTKASLSRIENGKQVCGFDLVKKVVTETGISARLLRGDIAPLFFRSARKAPGRARERAA